jgi:hypothetical protein
LLVLLITGSLLAFPGALEPAPAAEPQTRVPPALARYLARAQFGSDQYAALAAGRATSKVLELPNRDLLGVVAVVRIDRPPQRYVDAFRDIVSFEKSGAGVLAMGTFSKPPTLGDVKGLTVPDSDFETLPGCRVRDCDVNLSASTIEQFRKHVKWSGADALAQASRVWQAAIVEYVNEYQARGNSALMVYEDRDPAIALASKSTGLFADSDSLAPLPDVAAYFTQYRAAPLPSGAEEFFYWQQITFGMKPVTRVNHVVMTPLSIEGRPSWVIVSRMIYASHYFRDGLEVRYLVPVDGSPTPRAFYLVLVSRSHSESLTGLKGLLIGGIVRRKVRDSTARHVAKVKERLESRP